MTLNLVAGNSKTPIYEFAESSSAASYALYNPDGIEVGYGYDARKSEEEGGGQLRVFYGGLDESNNEIIYSGIENSAGLHNITLSRELLENERIIINWKNGYQLVIYEEGGTTKVKKRNGGSYDEIGKWADNTGNSEYTALYFDDDMNTKRFDKIETKSFEEIR